MIFKNDDRVLAHRDKYDRLGRLGTITDVGVHSCYVKLDEDQSIQIFPETMLEFVREDLRTDPASANYQLICKNCGWGGVNHVHFAPHYCREKVTRQSLTDGNDQPVPANAVFEARVITPLTTFRPDGSPVSREYVMAMKNFDPSVFKSGGKG